MKNIKAHFQHSSTHKLHLLMFVALWTMLQLRPEDKKRSYILRVRLLDGRLNPVTEVRVQVARAGETPSQFGPGMFDGLSGLRAELPQGLPEVHHPLFITPEPKSKLLADLVITYKKHVYLE